METAQKNFRKLIQYLKSRDDIELTTYRELMGRFSNQKDEISQGDLGEIAERILKENGAVIDDYYAPAEVFSALAGALDYYRAEQKLPAQMSIQRPFGPLEMPVIDPEFESVSGSEALELSKKAVEYMNETNHLPSALLYQDMKIGTGSLLALFSELYTKLQDSNLPDQIVTVSFEGYPSFNEEEIISEVASCKEWPVHREDLDMSHLIELTKLQLWTLKPAHMYED